MNKKDKGLMFGPLMPLNTKGAVSDIRTNSEVDMGAMTDLVRALKNVDASPEKAEQNKHSGTGSVSGKDIKLSEDNLPLKED